MTMNTKTLLLTLATALSAGWAQAACMSDAEVAALMDACAKRQPAANPEGLSGADGECSREKVLKILQAQMGAPVGYKAGLTNPAVQKRFEHDAPVWGMLFAPMLLKNAAIVDAAFGARPLFEADLLVRVSDEAINRAGTAEEVLRAIDQVIPFVELPDLVVQVPAPPKLNGAAIVAFNVGARLGVLGTPISVQAHPEIGNALRDMVTIIKGDGAELDRGRGSDVMGHPLNAVVWLAKDLARSGRSLKKGDLISLGSFSRLLPPKAGLAVEVLYQGLPGNPVVGLSFK
jgi:2-keto-4-pentenoate hydratase